MSVQWISLMLLTVIINEVFIIMVAATNNPEQLHEDHEVTNTNSSIKLRIALIGHGTSKQQPSQIASILRLGSLIYIPKSGTTNQTDQKKIKIGIPKKDSVNLEWESGDSYQGHELKIQLALKIIEADDIDLTDLAYFNDDLITISRKNGKIYFLDKSLHLKVQKNLNTPDKQVVPELKWATVQEIAGIQSLYVGMSTANQIPLKVAKINQQCSKPEIKEYTKLYKSLKNGAWMDGREQVNNEYLSISSCTWNDTNKKFYIMAYYSDNSTPTDKHKGMVFSAGYDLDEENVILVAENLYKNRMRNKSMKFLPLHENRIIVFLDEHMYSHKHYITLYDIAEKSVISSNEIVLEGDTRYTGFVFLPPNSKF